MKVSIENKGNANLSKKTSSNCILKKSIRIPLKKYIAPRIEWIPLDNYISSVSEITSTIEKIETLNSVKSPFKQESGLV